MTTAEISRSKLTMPSWKTGIQKRLRKYTTKQIAEAIGVAVFFGIMVFVFTIMIIVAIHTPSAIFQ